MNIGKAFKSNYLKAADIEDDNTIVTIDSIQMQDINGETKPVLYFNEFDAGLVLNKTNANAITEALGTPETDNWIGRQIVLCVQTVDFQGKPTEAIRVNLRAAKKIAQQVQAPTQPRGRAAGVQGGTYQGQSQRVVEDDDSIPF